MATEKRTVLIVDDEPDVCAYLSALLEDNGFRTVLAKDGEEAMAAVKRGAPDLITLDISMPEKSGVRFYREIRESEAWKKIPVVIVTGVSGDFERFISTRRQVPPPDGYMQKPIDPKQMLELVKQHTTRQRP